MTTTTPKPRDPRPTPEPAPDTRTPLEIAQDTATAAIAAAEAATGEALKWRLAHQYGLSDEDTELIFSLDGSETMLTGIAQRVGTKKPKPATTNSPSN